MTEKLFYFRGQDGAEVTLPVSPEYYEWSHGKRIETVTLTEMGEINRPGVPTLHKGSISCMFPARPYSFAKPGAGIDPMHYVGIFRGWAASREPVRYIVANGGINAMVLVEDIKWRVQDASGDVYATIYLAEYVDPEAPEVSNSDTFGTGNLSRPSENDGTARQYTIVKGDTLSAICRRYYGKSTSAYYNALAKYNGIKNPHLIYPGRTITVPPESVLLGADMELILTKAATGRSYDMTRLAVTVTWAGDKAAIARKLEGETLLQEAALTPELGDCVTLRHQGARLFEGWCVWRSARATGQTVRWYCYDRGMWLKNNDGTMRCDGESPEHFTRRVCSGAGVAVAGLPATGASIRRKFSAVPLTSILTTAWSLAEEQTGKRYAVRMTPTGLLVKERAAAGANLVLKPRSNLMEASTTESIVNMCNSVGIYDTKGTRLTTVRDEEANRLYGLMERHITQQSNMDADAKARKLIEDGGVDRSVAVDVLGDTRLITGETVEAKEPRTGLCGIFWVDADTHTWKKRNYYCNLALNFRNVTVRGAAGSEI